MTDERKGSKHPGTGRTFTMGNFAGGFAESVKGRDNPNTTRAPVTWIDYRESVGNVRRRTDAGETPEACPGCGTEVDVERPVHAPGCDRASSDG